ncbi:MAG: hypothetical protein JWN41_537 [Thermoleophilia bacterium]|nr:hypothetical protein [Thermoleophilia bacterium]
MTQLALLLRGINVGRAQQIAMADLRGVLEAGGFRRVQTLLRSGNVLVETDLSHDASRARARELIDAAFDMQISVVSRSHDELRHIVELNPLKDHVTNLSRYVVAFVEVPPSGSELADFVAATEPPDRAYATDRELVLWLPAGQADSPASKRLAKLRLPSTVTVRNWNTVTKLTAMFDGVDDRRLA